MKGLITLVTMISMMSVNSAYAHSGKDKSKFFEEHISAFQQSCVSQCQNPFSVMTAYKIEEAEKSKLNIQSRLHLEQIAVGQAQIWGDTILEGDYQSEGHTQLDRVLEIYENGRLLGYRITYSERAWYVCDCDFDDATPEALAQCRQGRIHESAFVSADFETFFRDESDLADFND